MLGTHIIHQFVFHFVEELGVLNIGQGLRIWGSNQGFEIEPTSAHGFEVLIQNAHHSRVEVNLSPVVILYNSFSLP